jgi:HSP90 family molecular chaperone
VPPDGGGLNLEINPKHEVIVRLNGLREKDADLAGQIADQLLDNARMAAGLLEDPRSMLQRINSLLQKLLEK